ncbi:MAG: hypothetical protein H7Y07_01370 [Pyrinomonadaceae bacterium]|nr:hypothetical protein [Sphingobacteriaceae bacterium]
MADFNPNNDKTVAKVIERRANATKPIRYTVFVWKGFCVLFVEKYLDEVPSSETFFISGVTRIIRIEF